MTFDRETYHKAKSKEHYQKNKKAYNERNQEQKARTRAIIAEAKNQGCVLCLEADPVCLDFHHLSDKDRTISSMLGMNDARVKAEIAKCVVVCSNCHRKIHANIVCLLKQA